MQIGIILQTVRDQLRGRFHWAGDQCRVTAMGLPPARAGEFFIGIFDGGTAAAKEEGYFLAETFQLEIAVWRRIGSYASDRQGTVLLEDDPHLGNVCLPSQLASRVQRFVHRNYRLMQAINAAHGSPAEASGSGLQSPFVFQGSRPSQVHTPSGGSASFAGRVLQFGGALHIDPISENDL